MTEMTPPRGARVNAIGLAQADYKGLPSTLCQGCGHNSIANQIVQVAYELNVRPHEMLKLSGIGCSSKSPAYFLGQSFGFNTLHGRMPSLATGALIANHAMRAIAVSGDGDTASIGLGQFKHLLRRNVRTVSYTHLDVYKRQEKERATKPQPARIASMQMSMGGKSFVPAYFSSCPSSAVAENCPLVSP